MRRRVQLRSVSEHNNTTTVWVQHLTARLIIEQLQLPYHLHAKLLHETMPKIKNEVK
ncbi:hypothetical protein Q7A53_09100 [Halobacillus rhizosphaerae]|uniref:hypothetical protein n=1 Tax=Halobacillus rhizosphaerae TaxID=3064889 RepID=UPI00398AEF6D